MADLIMQSASGTLVPTPSIDLFQQRCAELIAAAYVSKNTRRAYMGDVILWCDFCRAYDQNPWTAQPLAAGTFRQLDLLRHASSSTARTMAAMSILYDRLRQTNAGLINPFARTVTGHPPSQAVNPHPAVSSTDASRMFDVVATAASSSVPAVRREGLRDRALFALLWSTGVRRQFLAEAQRGDWSMLESGEAVFRSVWKGGTKKAIIVPGEAAQFVSAWLAETTGESLFGLTVNQIYHRVKARAKEAGVVLAGVKPHGFRAGFATRAYDAGVPEVEIVAAMGHAHASTTRQYDRGNRGAMVGRTVGGMPKRTT